MINNLLYEKIFIDAGSSTVKIIFGRMKLVWLCKKALLLKTDLIQRLEYQMKTRKLFELMASVKNNVGDEIKIFATGIFRKLFQRREICCW